jgi:hypothetical protein
MRDKIRTVQFEPFHLKLFKEGREYGQASVSKEMRAFMFRQVEGVTVMIGGEIACCVGLAPMWEGVAEATLVPSDTFYKYAKTLTRFIRDGMDILVETGNIHRVQALCLDKYPKHGRFMEALGFTREATIKAYDNEKNDYGMYAKFWG